MPSYMFKSLRRNLGALTSKPYSFKERSWELRNIHYIDLEDSFGSFLNYEVKGNRILKATPRINDYLNEVWLSDKARFNIDGINNQRLNNPVRCRRYHSRWTLPAAARVRHVNVRWGRGLKHYELMLVAGLFFKKKKKWPFFLHGVSGSMSSYNDLFLFKKFLNQLGSGNLYNVTACNLKKTNKLFTDFRSSYFLDNRVMSSDLIILGFINLRLESPILNIKFRMLSLKNKTKFLGFGVSVNNNLPGYTNLGGTLNSFLSFLEGRHISSPLLFNAKAPAVILGLNFIIFHKSYLILNLIYNLENLLKNLSVSLLTTHMGDISALDLGFTPSKFIKKSYHRRSLQIRSILKYWGYKDKFFSRRKHRVRSTNITISLGNSKISTKGASLYNIRMYKHVFLIKSLIFQGSHGFNNYIDFDLLIPSKLPVECDYNLYLNTLGNSIELNKLITVNDIWSNSEVFSYLYKKFKLNQGGSNLSNYLTFSEKKIFYPFYLKNFDKLSKNLIINRLSNYYISNIISENSWTMQKASKTLLNKINLNFK